ncbi:hypothetical protein RIF29_19078 [Crotalaria pallida]|uniref:Zuotin-like zuotin homology domain-containing protein n=1 Tax=Crotalaria pallida TaxID=3830 RepID=A0AAN9F0N5_CROPI
MERQNAKLSEKARKEESVRICVLVDNAYKRDPRILRRKEEEKAEKQRKKQAKHMAKKLQEEEAARIAEEERQYRDILKRQLRDRIRNTEVDKKVHRGFVHWFANRIANNLNDIRGSNDEDVLISLAQAMPRRKRDSSSTSYGASTIPSLSESVSQPDNIQDLEADLEAQMDEFSSSAKNKKIRHFWTVNVIGARKCGPTLLVLSQIQKRSSRRD